MLEIKESLPVKASFFLCSKVSMQFFLLSSSNSLFCTVNFIFLFACKPFIMKMYLFQFLISIIIEFRILSIFLCQFQNLGFRSFLESFQITIFTIYCF